MLDGGVVYWVRCIQQVDGWIDFQPNQQFFMVRQHTVEEEKTKCFFPYNS